MNDVDVYATGVLSELQAVGRCLDPTWPRRYRGPRILPAPAPKWRRKALRHFGPRLLRAVRRRNAWRGYYAEPRTPGFGRVGTGWTRRRALRSLERYMAEVCTCGHPGLTYDGPAEDCPQHGIPTPVCTTCGLPMDDPQWCSRNPATGKGGHTHGGGMAQA